MTESTLPTQDIEAIVRSRYSGAAAKPEADLCCPTSYDPALLTHIPEEVLRKDYGCGNPAKYLGEGERVLDLGSGAGKACFISARAVGEKGSVIGIDMNDDMLAVARKNAPIVAEKLGYANVAFRKGRIQDLALDLDLLARYLDSHPVRSVEALSAVDTEANRLRMESPMVADDSIDVVISSCVLNLVRPEDKARLFLEIHRVLRRGGRAVISDVVSDEDVPARLKRDPELWSGCISGAFREDRFLQAFEEAGFYGIRQLARGEAPWRTVDGIEFRSVTVEAFKGKEGPCIDRRHAVIYRGPFRQVEDDDGHLFVRGARTAVCEKTFEICSKEPYRDSFDPVPPRRLEPLETARPFPCGKGSILRHPSETKGEDYRATTEAVSCCDDEGCC